MGNVVKLSPKSRYAPIRYEATRPFAAQLGRRFVMETSGKTAEQRGAYISNQWMPLVREAVGKLGFHSGPGPGQAEMNNLQLFGGYQAAGKVIFDVRKELSRSLLITDAQDIPCSALVLPCDAFYIHFGQGSGLVDQGFEIEGVFVKKYTQTATEPARLAVDAVPMGYFAIREFWSLPMGEGLTGVSIDLSNSDESIVEALNRSIDHIVEANKAMYAQHEEFEKMLSAKYGEPIKVPTPIDNLGDKRDLLAKVLQLTTNTLFFLAAEPDDVYEDWDLSAPCDLIQQTHSDKPGTRRTAENTLAKQGYVKVRYVGGQYAASVGKEHSSIHESTGKTVTTHFRRGHFRRQPHGPERMLRKTIFIAPVLVNPGQGELPGRIYEVSGGVS